MDEKEAQEVEIREEVEKNEEKPVEDKGKFLARLKEKRAKKKEEKIKEFKKQDDEKKEVDGEKLEEGNKEVKKVNTKKQKMLKIIQTFIAPSVFKIKLYDTLYTKYFGKSSVLAIFLVKYIV